MFSVVENSLSGIFVGGFSVCVVVLVIMISIVLRMFDIGNS